MVRDKYAAIRRRIEEACARVGRDASSVGIVAVTKGRSVTLVQEAIEAGLRTLGENRVQEARDKISSFPLPASVFPPVSWHLIGHLQTNKVRDAVRMFDLIHSVDSVRLIRAIDDEARHVGKVQDVLIEVKTSPEVSKYGIKPEDTGTFLEETNGLKNVRIRGLMTIAPYSVDPQAARPYFRQLRLLRDVLRLRPSTIDLGPVLSMGMSDDFEVAVEEGSTMVRIGRALFE